MAIEQGLVELMVFVGAVMGAFAATMLPYWDKLRENPDLAFEKKFIGTSIVSFVTAMAIGIGLFPVLIQNIDATDATLSLAGIFAITAAASFGINRGANMAMSGPVAAELRAGKSSSSNQEKPA